MIKSVNAGPKVVFGGALETDKFFIWPNMSERFSTVVVLMFAAW